VDEVGGSVGPPSGDGGSKRRIDGGDADELQQLEHADLTETIWS